MLFFTLSIGAIGITSEPKYCYDSNGVRYNITYVGYIYNTVRSRYVVCLYCTANADTYVGVIPWNLKKPVVDLKKAKFFDKNNPAQALELSFPSPFPCAKARDFIEPKKELLIDLDPFSSEQEENGQRTPYVNDDDYDDPEDTPLVPYSLLADMD